MEKGNVEGTDKRPSHWTGGVRGAVRRPVRTGQHQLASGGQGEYSNYGIVPAGGWVISFRMFVDDEKDLRAANRKVHSDTLR